MLGNEQRAGGLLYLHEERLYSVVGYGLLGWAMSYGGPTSRIRYWYSKDFGHSQVRESRSCSIFQVS